MSKSGSDTRPGLRKRSKSRLDAREAMAVTPRDYPTGADAGGRLQRCVHFLWRLDVQLLGVVPQALGIFERAPRGDGHQDFVRLRVLSLHVMAVGSGDEGEPLLPRQLAHPVVDRELFLQRVALDLQIEPIAEDGLEIPHLAARLVHVATADSAWHRARHAGGERDQSLAVRLEQGLVDARVVVEAVGERLAAQIA